MNTNTTTSEVRAMIGGRIFGATFVKRDGTVRTGAFRFGVRHELKGVGMRYDAAERRNLVVFDMRKREYRTIRLESLVSLRVRGTTITVES